MSRRAQFELVRYNGNKESNRVSYGDDLLAACIEFERIAVRPRHMAEWRILHSSYDENNVRYIEITLSASDIRKCIMRRFFWEDGEKGLETIGNHYHEISADYPRSRTPMQWEKIKTLAGYYAMLWAIRAEK